MNGVHDLGGMHGLGPIVREDHEPYFHEKWEERVFGLFFGCFAGGHFNIDMFRHAIERMPGAHYLESSYYEHWLHSIQTLLIEKGTLTRNEVERRMAPLDAVGAHAPPTSALPVEMVDGLLRTGASARLPDQVDARFMPGDAVIARNLHPLGHTRLPRYIRGKRGVVTRDHGVFCFNDTAAHGLGHKAQHVYSVRFAARELWGSQASERDSVFIDLFDDYLEPVGAGQ